jgi:excisionase family DNA binding protein
MKQTISIDLTEDQIKKIVESQLSLKTEPITFSISGAAKKIGISRANIYILINSGQIKKITVGRSPRIHIDEINKFLL